MTSRLQDLADAFVARTTEDILLAISEGFVKVRCAEAALSLGWTLQEGSRNKPTGPMADYATMLNGRVAWRRDPRKIQLPEGSSDLAVVSPFEMFLEIKTRPDHGTKSGAQFQDMDADVARIAQNRQCALLFIFEPVIYASFSGEKTERRGRPAVADNWFTTCFPSASEIPRNRWYSITASRDSATLNMAFRTCPHTAAEDTILVIGSRSDSGL